MSKKKLIENLYPLISDEKKVLFESILKERTRYITVVLEDIYQPQNASAVMRTTDCFGVQDVHVIENQNEYNINPRVTLGSTKWINILQYNDQGNNTTKALKALKQKGYRIVGTSPHLSAKNLADFDVSKGKFALVFGNELNGISKEAIQEADEFITIPMYGFTESFNLSVSAALCLNELCHKIRSKQIDYHLSESEKETILLNWITQTIKHGEKVVEEIKERL